MRQEKIKTVFKIAKGAGKILTRHFNSQMPEKIWYKKYHEATSSADIAAERYIVSNLQKYFPGDEILTEESGYNGPLKSKTGAKSDRIWVIDPLDGTNNFLHKNPLFAVNIGLVKKGKITFGVVYLPLTGQLFWAVKGGGAFLGNRRIAVSKTKKLKDALVNACYGHDPKYKRRDYYVAREVDRRSRFTRRPGAAGFEITSVALGGADAAYILGTRPWDAAAGAIIVTEAGGKVTDLKGKPWNFFDENIVVSNGKVHNQLLKLLR